MTKKGRDGKISRRNFIKGAAAAGVAVGSFRILHASPKGGGRQFKVGLIGCGGRGNGAISDHVRAAKALEKALNLGLEVKPWAFADWHKRRAEGTGRRYAVPKERCFGGADAYRKLIESGVDTVLMATPPAFRPYHLRAAIEGGKSAAEFESWLKGFNDPNMLRIAHVCYGFNPGAKLTGDIVEDERVWGCTEWGLGNFPGRPAASHTDGICLNSTVWVDGEQILDKGVSIHPELAKLAKKLGKQ